MHENVSVISQESQESCPTQLHKHAQNIRRELFYKIEKSNRVVTWSL